MIPHERSLVHRLENKPFALLGINSDPGASYRSAVQKEGITWKSWWDGGNPMGPIATRWNVYAWPTIYVLDAKGVIRYRDVRGESMDAAVDALLKEIKGDAPPPSQ
jgi:hypothetical protein